MIDDPGMLAIAKDIGAFAGYWFDDQGQLIVAMTDMSRSVDAERAVRLRMGSHETRVGHVDGTSVRIVTRGAKYGSPNTSVAAHRGSEGKLRQE